MSKRTGCLYSHTLRLLLGSGSYSPLQIEQDEILARAAALEAEDNERRALELQELASQVRHRAWFDYLTEDR